jgi:predicted ribosome quality control (RQC) complex YloA/Tae2 family protein
MKALAFNYPLMKLLCRELQERVKGFKVVDCLPNNLERFSFVLHENQRREALFFCFDPPFIRFHLIPMKAIPIVRSSHPLLSFLKDAILKNVSLLQEDRILQLTFMTSQGERFFVAEFFSKHPNYYLLQPDGTILFALHHLGYSHYRLPSKISFSSSGSPLWSSHEEVARAYEELENQKEFNAEKQLIQTQLRKLFQKLKRKEQEILENLKQCSQWTKVQHEGELFKFYFTSIKKGCFSVAVHDWETDQEYRLTLDPRKTTQEEMAGRFKKAKKLQAGIVPLTQYLERIQKELKFIDQQQHELDSLKTLEELSSLKTSLTVPSSKKHETISAEDAKRSSIYREYRSAKGLKIWVGKNAKANDRLTFQLANGRDWWMHTKGCSGSHVIIRLSKDQEPDPETLKDAMQLALYHSKGRAQGEGEICVTQRKYVSRLGRGKAGLVQISKHQTAWIRFDPARFRALQERF